MSRRKRTRFSLRKNSPAGKTLRRRLLIWLSGAIVLLLLLLVIGYFQLIAYLRGDDFRRSLEENLCNSLRAESVSIPTPLSIEGAHVGLESAALRRTDAVKALSLRDIQAQTRRWPLLDRCLHVTDLRIARFEASFDLARLNEPLPERRQDEESFVDRFKPNHLILERLICPDLNISLTHGSLPVFSLSDCSVQATPAVSGPTDQWSVDLKGGNMGTGWDLLHSAELESAELEASPDRLRLSQATLHLSPGEGELRASGEWSGPRRNWKLRMHASRIETERLLKGDWKKRLHGTVTGQLDMEGRGSGLRAAEGYLTLNHAVLEGLPILSELPLPDSQAYRSLGLEKATCRVHYPFSQPSHRIQDAWLFDDIEVRARENRLLVTGRVLIGSDGRLGGTLKIGIAESYLRPLLQVAPETMKDIFNADGEPGYCWLNLNLSGTLTAPIEDLSARLREKLRTLPGISVISDAGAAGTATAKSISESLGNLIRSSANSDTADKDRNQGSSPTRTPRNSSNGENGNGRPASDSPSSGAEDEDEGDESLPGTLIRGAGESAGKLLDGIF